jgi:hypothetical protein
MSRRDIGRFDLFKALPPGAQWITVRPNGPGTDGHPGGRKIIRIELQRLQNNGAAVGACEGLCDRAEQFAERSRRP